MDVDLRAFKRQLVAELERLRGELEFVWPMIQLQINTSQGKEYPFWLTGSLNAGNPDKNLVVAIDVWTSSRPLPGQQIDAYLTKLECDVFRFEEVLLEGPSVRSCDELSSLSAEFNRWSAEVIEFLRNSTSVLVSSFLEMYSVT